MDSTTCTTSAGQIFTIADLQKAMNDLPEPPKVFAMDYEILFSSFLTPNTIIISKDIADALELQEAS